MREGLGHHLLHGWPSWGPILKQTGTTKVTLFFINHDDVFKSKHFSRDWPFVRGIHRSPVNSPHKGQWCGALMFSLICAWINGWVNNCEAGDLRRHLAHYDVIVMYNNGTGLVLKIFKQQGWVLWWLVWFNLNECLGITYHDCLGLRIPPKVVM